MPTRRLPLANSSPTQFILLGKVSFEGFVVPTEQMFPCHFSFTKRSCGLLLYSGCLWFLIFALLEIDL